jgi:quercetin dioxygenase-like cupin family protein
MWKQSELTERVKSAKADATGMAGGGIGNLGGYQAIMVRRDKTGEAEIHQKMIDIMIVTDGEATLKVGGTVSETRPNTPDEIRGKSLTGSVDKKIGPGDTIYLPAGTAHWVVVPEGKTITYLLLKLDKK